MTDEFGRRFALLTDYAHKQGNNLSVVELRVFQAKSTRPHMKVRERGTHRGDQQIKTVNLDHGFFDSSIGFGDSPGITDDLQYKAIAAWMDHELTS